jgi:sulfide:quinone oxidoreductase
VVAGGGIAGIEALLSLHALAGDRVDLTLADAQRDFVYRPMTVAEPFARGIARRHPIATVAADVGARLVADNITEVDPIDRVARTAGGEALRYDALLLATGAGAVPPFANALTWDDRSGPTTSAACCATSNRASCAAWRPSSRAVRAGRCPPTSSRS